MSNEPVNVLPSAGASFLVNAQTFWRDELAAMHRRLGLQGCIYAGGLHGTSASKTSSAFATEAFTSLGDRITADGAGGTVAIPYGTYGAADNDTCWVIISDQDTSPLGNFVRVGSSNYFVNVVDATQPALPSDSCYLMKVTISGAAITGVQDLRVPVSFPQLGMYSVKDPLYGAVGDGVTNDKTAIQNCFDAACYGGNKTVYFPAGSYHLGTATGGTNILNLSALGDGIAIKTSGFVELVCNTGSLNSIPRFFYLANNSHFYCDPIHFRDTGGDQTDAVVNAGDQRGAVGFYIQNATPANWGDLYFTKIYATNMIAAVIIVQKSGAAATYASRIRNVRIGQIVCEECYYGFNGQNDGDNVTIGLLYNTLGRRIYYVYGVSDHTVVAHDYNGRGSTGKCYIARQVGGLNTTGINLKYRNRSHNLAGGVLVAIDHIDLLGGEIAGITVDVDVKESSASYIPVKFRNYTGSGGSETSNPSTNYTRDIRLSGSCDANALACTTTTSISYAAKRLLDFIPGYNFLPDQQIYNAFQLGQVSHAQATPEWKGDSVDPGIGNGTILYNLDIINGMAFVSIEIDMGSTTTYGTGNWYFQVPNITASQLGLGAAFYLDAGTAIYTGTAVINAGSSSIYLYTNNGAGQGVRSTVPHTWASTDKLQFSIAFPVAA